MAKEYYTLNPEERIILSAENVAHNSSLLDDQIVLTTERIIIGDFGGVLRKVQRIWTIPFNQISQALSKGKQFQNLELYVDGVCHSIQFFYQEPYTGYLWAVAINDRFSEYADILGYEFYNSLSYEQARQQAILELNAEEQGASQEDGGKTGAIGFVGDVAKNLARSKRFTPVGVAKSVAKAAAKQKANSAWREATDDFFLSPFKEAGKEMSNSIRSHLGLNQIVTKEDRIEMRTRIVFDRQIDGAKRILIGDDYNAIKNQNTQISEEEKEAPKNNYSVDQQIEMLSQLKSLLDAGILTPEEFEKKKSEILN